MKNKIAKAAVGTALVFAAPFAFAQTSTTTSTTTPGTPDTGVGGDMAQNILLLGVSAAATLGAAAYLASRRKVLAR